MNNREAINRFHDLISWVDQCTEAIFEDRLITFSPSAVYLPINWQDYKAGFEIAVRASVFYKLRPAMLITGDAPHRSVEEIWWSSHQYNPLIYCVWIEIEQSLWATSVTTRALDGIDWNQSFKQGKAIY